MKELRYKPKHAVSSGASRGKTAALVLVLALALSCAVGGTLAWLSDQTDPVVNTFTYGDIDITLTETDTGDGDDDPNTNQYKMLPGKTIIKDPKVTVLGGSEDCWLFVQLDKSENFDSFMTYEIANGWTALEGETDVYYRQVSRSENDQEFPVIQGNTVSVKDTVTKDELNALDETPGAETYPTLTITAYAVQYDANLEAINSAADAWVLVTQAQTAEDSDAVDGGEEPETT